MISNLTEFQDSLVSLRYTKLDIIEIELTDFKFENREMGIALKIAPSKVFLIKEQLKSLNLTKETIYGQEHSVFEDYTNSIIKRSPKI